MLVKHEGVKEILEGKSLQGSKVINQKSTLKSIFSPSATMPRTDERSAVVSSTKATFETNQADLFKQKKK